jgi:SAM-dependent methyltransferase
MGGDVALDPAREEAELRSYLGDDFRLDRLQHYQEHLDEEVAEIAHEDTFYLTSKAYLYNLTAFAMTGTKDPYRAWIDEALPGGGRVLDVGCGIGSDGLSLIAGGGHTVTFADFDNPSVAYLRWRLAERGLDAPIHDLKQGVPEGFDAAYAFDVIEHVPDAFAFLGEMEKRARLVCVNFLEPEPDDQDLHHELPIPELLRHVADRRLRHYALLHHRSHLVLYEPERANPLARRLHRARLRSR